MAKCFTPEQVDDGVQFVSSWIKDEVELCAWEGHVLRRCLMSPIPPVYPGESTDDDAARVRAFLETFEPSELLKRHEEGDPDADGVLCGVAKIYLEEGKVMPPALAAHVMEVLHNRFMERPRLSGGDPYGNLWRDRVIHIAAFLLMTLGVRLSRNREQKDRECTYSIIAKVLTDAGVPTTERAVEEVARKGPPQWVRDDVERMLEREFVPDEGSTRPV